MQTLEVKYGETVYKAKSNGLQNVATVPSIKTGIFRKNFYIIHKLACVHQGLVNICTNFKAMWKLTKLDKVCYSAFNA